MLTLLLVDLKNCLNFFADAEYEFIGMGNRHIPTKCIALGTWDQPGTHYIFISQHVVYTVWYC